MGSEGDEALHPAPVSTADFLVGLPEVGQGGGVEVTESGLVGEGELARTEAFEQSPQCDGALVVEGREHGQFVDGPLRQLIDDRRTQAADDADLWRRGCPVAVEPVQ